MQYQPHKDWFFQLSSLCLVFAEKKQSLLRVLKHFLFLCELLLKVSFILNCYPTYNGQHKKLNGQKVDGSFLKELCWVLLFKLIQVDVFFISKKFTSWKFWHSIMSTKEFTWKKRKNDAALLAHFIYHLELTICRVMFYIILSTYEIFRNKCL